MSPNYGGIFRLYNPATRLLSILELLQSRGEVSGQELADALEVDDRSVRRYILMLRDMGIPVEGERGRHGGYSLRPGFRLPPMMFNADEILAVMMGLMLLEGLGSTPPLALESAAAKIRRVLPETLRESTDALRHSLLLDDAVYAAYPISNQQLYEVSLAVYQGRCLHLTYQSPDGEITERLIAPYGLVLQGRLWYLPAYCFLRDDIRLFRLDRARALSRSDQTFTSPPDFNSQQFVLDALARLPGTYTFEVLLDTPLSTVQEIIPPGMAVLESRGEATLMRCYSDDPHWFARYLTRLELPFTVLETDELRDALRDLADELLASLGISGGL
jgi:predicted DNA-binding transcriptional regulator YafY